MSAGFPELVIGGVLIASSVNCAAAAVTATVSLRGPALEVQGSWWQQRLGPLGDRLTALHAEPPTRPGCVPARGADAGRTVTIPTPEPSPARGPGQIDPGLAPGPTMSPDRR